MNSVVPVVTLKLGQTTGSATTRTDAYVVPAGKRWLVRHAASNRANTGTSEISLIIGGVTCNFWAQATATQHTYPGLNLIMAAGDTVNVYCGTGTAGSINTNLLYEETTL